MPYNDPIRTKRFLVQLDEDTRKRLKLLAVKLDITMDKLVAQLIKDRLDAEEKIRIENYLRQNQ